VFVNINEKLCFVFLITLICVFHGSFAFAWLSQGIYEVTHRPNNDSGCLCKSRHKSYHDDLLSNGVSSNYNPIEKSVFQNVSCAEFQALFQNVSNESTLIKHLELFADQDFLACVRTFDCYDSIILNLKNKIDHDKMFRNKTKNISGFTYKHFLWWEKSGFHTFINEEAERIKNKRAHEAYRLCCEQEAAQKKQKEKEYRQQYCLHVDNTQELDVLIQEYTQQACVTDQAGNSDISTRLMDRARALEKTRNNPDAYFDYASHVPRVNGYDKYADVFSKTYGAALDCQLHMELCETRNAMIDLECNSPQNFRIKIIAPVVHHLAAQAKCEHNVYAAFELLDICYALTNVIRKGLQAARKYSCAVVKGIASGVTNVFSFDYWKEMATSALPLGVLFLDAVGQEEARQNIFFAVPLSKNNHDMAIKVAQEYSLHSLSQINGIHRQLQKTYKKVLGTSWETLIERGAQLGIMMILDVLLLNAVLSVANATGRAAVQQINSVLERGMLFTEQHTVEVAGFGKLILEEGPEAAQWAATAIKETPNLLRKEGKSAANFIKKTKNVTQIFNKDRILKGLDSLNANKIKHIIEGSKNSNHKWGKLVPDKNWNDIKKIIAEVMGTGSDKSYGSAQVRVKTIRGEVVEVTHVEINGVKKISNAWIK